MSAFVLGCIYSQWKGKYPSEASQRLQLVKDLNILLHCPGAITYLIHVSALNTAA